MSQMPSISREEFDDRLRRIQQAMEPMKARDPKCEASMEPKHIRFMRALAILGETTQALIDLKIAVTGAPAITSPEDRERLKEAKEPEARRQLVSLAQFLDDAPERIMRLSEMIEENVCQLKTALYG